MNTTTIRITTQVSENYGCANEPFWKLKGGQEFTIESDLDIYMYAKDFWENAVKIQLAEKSNTHIKYEYLSSEPLFHKPIELDGKKCMESIREQYKKTTLTGGQ
jgi:hypothetical protein